MIVYGFVIKKNDRKYSIFLVFIDPFPLSFSFLCRKESLFPGGNFGCDLFRRFGRVGWRSGGVFGPGGVGSRRRRGIRRRRRWRRRKTDDLLTKAVLDPAPRVEDIRRRKAASSRGNFDRHPRQRNRRRDLYLNPSTSNGYMTFCWQLWLSAGLWARLATRASSPT